MKRSIVSGSCTHGFMELELDDEADEIANVWRIAVHVVFGACIGIKYTVECLEMNTFWCDRQINMDLSEMETSPKWTKFGTTVNFHFKRFHCIYNIQSPKYSIFCCIVVFCYRNQRHTVEVFLSDA